MEIAKVIEALSGAPMTLVLLYLLLQEKRASEALRASHDAERREWWETNSSTAKNMFESAERTAAALDKMSDAIERLRAQ